VTCILCMDFAMESVWNIMSWQCISPEVTVKGQMQWMRLIMMWNVCKEDGHVRGMTAKGMAC